jgi:hypothetical protein
MNVLVAPVNLVHGARLLAGAVHTYVWQFGQLALLTVPSMQNSPALLPLFEHQPGDRLLTLIPVVSTVSDLYYSYPVRLEERFRTPCYMSMRFSHALDNTSTLPIGRCLRNVQHAFHNTVTSAWQ